jgi:hypothetical protein
LSALNKREAARSFAVQHFQRLTSLHACLPFNDRDDLELGTAVLVVALSHS